MTLLEEIPTGRYREASIPVLETKRNALRAARLEDAKAVAALANDRRIAENTARIPHPYKLADAEQFIAGANKNGEAAYLVTLRNETIIGACGLMFRQDDAPEIGYWLGVPYWDKGYATAARHALIDYRFTDLAHGALQAVGRLAGSWRNAASSGPASVFTGSTRSNRRRRLTGFGLNGASGPRSRPGDARSACRSPLRESSWPCTGQQPSGNRQVAGGRLRAK